MNTFVVSVVGEKEATAGTINVRTRDNKVHGEKSVQTLLDRFATLGRERLQAEESEEDF